MYDRGKKKVSGKAETNKKNKGTKERKIWGENGDRIRSFWVTLIRTLMTVKTPTLSIQKYRNYGNH